MSQNARSDFPADHNPYSPATVIVIDEDEPQPEGNTWTPPAHYVSCDKDSNKCVDWGGVINNYSQAEYLAVRDYAQPEYMVLGKEVGESV